VSFLNSLFGAKASPRMVEVTPLGTRFEVPAGKTILEAALAAGIAFPHDCTVGTCGTCKSRLTVGRVSALSEFAYTLSQQELAANFILPCQSMPRDALVQIEVEVLSQRTDSHERYEGRIVATVPLTHDILQIHVELDRPIRYIAGQYANVDSPDGGRVRSYSFAAPSPPDGSREVTFCVRKVPGGVFTEALFANRLAGVALQIDGPHGAFHLRNGRGPIVCVAGGSGLPPILSMLEEAASRAVTRPGVLLFGARSMRDLYAIERIDAITSRWAARFVFLPVLSHELGDSAWSGARGLVTEYIADVLPGVDWATVQGYLCGPPGMIDVAIAALTAHGVGLNSIFYDKFTDASHAARMS
jgi:p-cymene monooxygenase electron transfer component